MQTVLHIPWTFLYSSGFESFRYVDLFQKYNFWSSFTWRNKLQKFPDTCHFKKQQVICSHVLWRVNGCILRPAEANKAIVQNWHWSWWKNDRWLEQCINIRSVQLGKRISQTLHVLTQGFGADALKESRVFEWIKICIGSVRHERRWRHGQFTTHRTDEKVERVWKLVCNDMTIVVYKWWLRN
jgi:hypothetical protein